MAPPIYFTNRHADVRAMGLEALPCPFCHGTRLGVQRLVGQFVVTCGDCGADGPINTGKEPRDAVHAWNARSKPQNIMPHCSAGLRWRGE